MQLVLDSHVSLGYDAVQLPSDTTGSGYPKKPKNRSDPGTTPLKVIETMFNPGRLTNVRRADIEEMKPSPVSMMPAGLLNSLTEDEIQDLLAFLLARPVAGQGSR